MDCCYITTQSPKFSDLQVEGIKFEMISMNNVQTPKQKQQSLCLRLEFSLCHNSHCTYYNMLFDGLQFSTFSYIVLAHSVDRWCSPCSTSLCCCLVMFYVLPSIVHMLFNCVLWPPFPYLFVIQWHPMLNSSHYGILFHGFFFSPPLFDYCPMTLCILSSNIQHGLFLVTLSIPSPICIATWWCYFCSHCNLMVSFPSLVLHNLHAIIQWHSSILLFMFFSCLVGISFFILFFNGILWLPPPLFAYYLVVLCALMFVVHVVQWCIPLLQLCFYLWHCS